MHKNRLNPAGRNGHDATKNSSAPEARGSTDADNLDDAVDFGAGGQNEKTEMPVSDAIQLLLRQISELRAYFSYYLSAKADSARVGLRNALFNMTLAALAFVVVASLSVAAIWFVLNGAAEGLAVLFGNRPWAGSLVTGLLLVIGLALGMFRVVIRLKKIAREGTIAKYENQQSRQQARYGHNVAGRAAAHDSEQK